MNYDDKNTVSYNMQLAELTIELANSYPNFKFVLKEKFKDSLFGRLKDRVLPANIDLASNLYNNEAIIQSSGIVISIGFTSPGVDALMQHKPTLIFSRLHTPHNPLNDFGCIATNRDEFLRLFHQIASSGQMQEYDLNGLNASISLRDSPKTLIIKSLQNEQLLQGA
jgi:hypothetical protein